MQHIKQKHFQNTIKLCIENIYTIISDKFHIKYIYYDFYQKGTSNNTIHISLSNK